MPDVGRCVEARLPADLPTDLPTGFPAGLTESGGGPIFLRMKLRSALLIALLAGFLASPPGAHARAQAPEPADGVVLGPPSRLSALAPAESVEAQALTQYRQLLDKAAAAKALAPAGHPQVQRLRRIAGRLIPHATRFNERAVHWKWEVNLIGSKQVNAFCMPGGKIAFYSGILDTLKLTDDEIAIVMGHEIAHALREHGRERVGKARLAQGLTIGASILSQLFGYGDLGGHLASGAAQLTMLKFGRDDEVEADLVGMDIAARAGFDPRAGIVLWEKMAAASKGQPPEWLSTHPSHETRVEEIRRNLQATLPLYARTRGTTAAALPAYRSNNGAAVR